jgi:hypothetical protein
VIPLHSVTKITHFVPFVHPVLHFYASQNRAVTFGLSRFGAVPGSPQQNSKKMLTRFCTRYTFRSAILKDRLHSASARLSVNPSIDYWAPARHLMRPKCAVCNPSELGKMRDSSCSDAAILISETAQAASWLDDFASKI